MMTRPTVRRRWPWYLLVVSLSANMLLGGSLAAQALHHPPPPDAERDVAHFVERASRVLPPADAVLLRGAFEAERGSLARLQGNMDNMRRILRGSLLSSSFDADILRRAMEQVQATDHDMRRRVESKVVETLSRMSDEGRRRLSDLDR